LTSEGKNIKGQGMTFGCKEEVFLALDEGRIGKRAKIKLRIEPYYRIVEPGQSPYNKDQVINKERYTDYLRKSPHDKQFKASAEPRKVIGPDGVQTSKNGLFETTVGRVMFNDILPEK